MGSTKADEKENRFSKASNPNLKLANATNEALTGREALVQLNRPAGPLPSHRKHDELTGILQNSSAPKGHSLTLASAQKPQTSAGHAQSQPATKPAAGSSTASPKVTYKANKPTIPPMRSETQAIVETAVRQAGVSSIKISSTQEGSFTDKKRVHDINSNHYNRPGKLGTSADISEIDGRPVSTYSTDPYVKQKVDALQQAFDREGAHENFGPSRIARDGRPVAERSPEEKRKAKHLRDGHRDHVHIDPPRRKSGQKP